MPFWEWISQWINQPKFRPFGPKRSQRQRRKRRRQMGGPF